MKIKLIAQIERETDEKEGGKWDRLRKRKVTSNK